MANQIAAHFRHHPSCRAATEVADHIRSFWTPAMIETLMERSQTGSHMDATVIAALRQLCSEDNASVNSRRNAS